jgi:hypothetical protein
MTKAGEPIRHDDTEIIRRVFREAAAGISLPDIANRLNDEGIPPPQSSAKNDDCGGKL